MNGLQDDDIIHGAQYHRRPRADAPLRGDHDGALDEASQAELRAAWQRAGWHGDAHAEFVDERVVIAERVLQAERRRQGPTGMSAGQWLDALAASQRAEAEHGAPPKRRTALRWLSRLQHKGRHSQG